MWSDSPQIDCPYRGLEAFDEGHARFFFGREAMTQHLVERLRHTRFLAILGRPAAANPRWRALVLCRNSAPARYRAASAGARAAESTDLAELLSSHPFIVNGSMKTAKACVSSIA